MIARAIRLTEDVAVLSLLGASALAMHIAALRRRRRSTGSLGASFLY